MDESKRYPVPAGTVQVEEVIRRSRFITTLAPAATEDEVKAFIEDIRSRSPDATHHCFAYCLGPSSSQKVGMSDDGEPHNTAGRPMLNVLQHSSVGDVVAVVTRYFGGTKLGTGGLVRAYSGGVQRALATLTVTEKITWSHLQMVVDYSALEQLRRLCPSFEAEIKDKVFAAQVEVSVRVPEERADAFLAAITDRVRDKITVIES